MKNKTGKEREREGVGDNKTERERGKRMSTKQREK